MLSLNRHTVITVQPSIEPVTVAEFKTFAKVSGSQDDGLITDLLKDARIACENYTNRSFINTTYKQVQDCFEYDNFGGYSVYNQLAYEQDVDLIDTRQGYIKLAYPSVSSITSLTTYNSSNVAAVYSSDNYFLDDAGGKLIIDEGATMPTDIRTRAGIECIFVAGYGASAADVPSIISRAIIIYAQSMYVGSKDVANAYKIPEAVRQMLNPYRLEIRING